MSIQTKIGIWSLLFFLFGNCSQPTPEMTIPEHKMYEILKEIHIAEGYLQTSKLSKRDSLAGMMYSSILKKHKIMEEDFYYNMELLYKQPKKVQTMYEGMVSDLKKMQKPKNSQIKKEGKSKKPE